MTTSTTAVSYDPYVRAIDADPYPVYRRLREEVQPLLQRAVRLLRLQPLRRRAADARGSRDLQLRTRVRARVHQGEHRDAARRRDLRGPTPAHRSSQLALPGVHSEEGERAGTPGPCVLRTSP